MHLRLLDRRYAVLVLILVMDYNESLDVCQETLTFQFPLFLCLFFNSSTCLDVLYGTLTSVGLKDSAAFES